jgi:sec-independent protein translocase protein TatC
MATTAPEEEAEDKKMPLLDHLIELRQRLIWSVVALAICFILGYALSGVIFDFLVRPLQHIASPDGQRRMIFTAPTEAFFTYVKVAFFAAIFMSFPVVAAQIWMFVAPGLYKHEKKAFLPFLAATPLLFLLGAAFLYFLILPAALKFFASFEVPAAEGQMPIQLEAKMSEYLSLVMTLILAFGISFELPVLLVLLAKVGIVSSETLASKRRYAIVGIVAFAGVVTPPDVFSQLSLAVPMYLLYEISIWIAKFVEKKREEEEAKIEAEIDASLTPRPAAAAAGAGVAVATVDETDFNLTR